MSSMLCHPDSVYIRCIGFLYLRYSVDPSTLWKWFEPYLYDAEPLQITASLSSTIGQYARNLLTEMKYVGTLLPRLPVVVERDIKCKLLLAEKNEQRARAHLLPRSSAGGTVVDYFEEGVRVRALYGDEENPVSWYDAIIDRVIRRDDETGEELARPKYVVTFPAYGNTEIVTLGELELPLASPPATNSSYENGLTRRGYYDNRLSSEGRVADEGDRFRHQLLEYKDQHRPADEGDLMEEVLKRERERMAAKGRDYSRRPPSIKSSIAAKQDRDSRPLFTGRRSRSPERSEKLESRASDIDSKIPASLIPQKKEKSSSEVAAIVEKKRRLLEKYG
mmetsp:Transcript_27103/g.38842  ORF Transcript_27103/g.38842 Transcript_27103/m.38842 type:complete len:335 (-) Transcript_27103:649-1653(-)